MCVCVTHCVIVASVYEILPPWNDEYQSDLVTLISQKYFREHTPQLVGDTPRTEVQPPPPPTQQVYHSELNGTRIYRSLIFNNGFLFLSLMG